MQGNLGLFYRIVCQPNVDHPTRLQFAFCSRTLRSHAPVKRTQAPLFQNAFLLYRLSFWVVNISVVQSRIRVIQRIKAKQNRYEFRVQKVFIRSYSRSNLPCCAYQDITYTP